MGKEVGAKRRRDQEDNRTDTLEIGEGERRVRERDGEREDTRDEEWEGAEYRIQDKKVTAEHAVQRSIGIAETARSDGERRFAEVEREIGEESEEHGNTFQQKVGYRVGGIRAETEHRKRYHTAKQRE